MKKSTFLYALPFVALALIGLVGGTVPVDKGLPDDGEALCSGLPDVSWCGEGWVSASVHEPVEGTENLPAMGVSLPEFGYPKLENGQVTVTITRDMGVPENYRDVERERSGRNRSLFEFGLDKDVSESAGDSWLDSRPSWGWLADGVLEMDNAPADRFDEQSSFMDTFADRDAHLGLDVSEPDWSGEMPLGRAWKRRGIP